MFEIMTVLILGTIVFSAMVRWCDLFIVSTFVGGTLLIVVSEILHKLP